MGIFDDFFVVKLKRCKVGRLKHGIDENFTTFQHLAYKIDMKSGDV